MKILRYIKTNDIKKVEALVTAEALKHKEPCHYEFKKGNMYAIIATNRPWKSNGRLHLPKNTETDNKFLDVLAEFLLERRITNNLTQEKFAKTLGISLSSYCKIEGKVRAPSVSTIDKIFRAYDIKLTEIAKIKNNELLKGDGNYE